MQIDFQRTLTLDHDGDCSLLGMSADGTVYVEEIYGDGWLAQHAFAADGTRVASIDEDEGRRDDLRPLALPPDILRPQPGWHSVALNFAGPRHRGMRDAERVADVVQGLTVQDKMALASRYALPVPPPMLLGLAESVVLAEAALQPHLYVVCRRIRFAHALATVCTDEAQQPYDYDSFVVYLAHVYDRGRDVPDLTAVPEDALPGVALRRPMDCLIRDDQLVVADGGADGQPARVHLWRVRRDD